MRKLLYSPWQTLSIPSALTPIGQLHQYPPFVFAIFFLKTGSEYPKDVQATGARRRRGFSPNAAARNSRSAMVCFFPHVFGPSLMTRGCFGAVHHTPSSSTRPVSASPVTRHQPHAAPATLRQPSSQTRLVSSALAGFVLTLV